MNIIVSEFDFFFFMFFTATFYAISAYLFIMYRKNGDAVKEEIDSIINHGARNIKKNLEKLADEQIMLFSRYIELAEKLSNELEIGRKNHFECESKIHDLIEKFEALENKLNKGIMERDGKISRKNREIEKLKERIKKLEKDNEC